MTYSKIKDEWDSIAGERLIEFERKTDLSYEKILKPEILKEIIKNDISNILDIGCGVGALTKEVSKFARIVTGIDISTTSIHLAKTKNNSDNIFYRVQNVEDLNDIQCFSLAYSNMVLMNMPRIDSALVSIYNSLIYDAKLVFTVSHPAFWPIYWNYFSKNNFNYSKQSELVKEFKTKQKQYTGYNTRHFHRPIESYIRSSISAGFKLVDLKELSDDDCAIWYPRFILFVLEKS